MLASWIWKNQFKSVEGEFAKQGNSWGHRFVSNRHTQRFINQKERRDTATWFYIYLSLQVVLKRMFTRRLRERNFSSFFYIYNHFRYILRSWLPSYWCTLISILTNIYCKRYLPYLSYPSISMGEHFERKIIGNYW